MILVFPSGFIFRMIRPLHLKELGDLATSLTFRLVEYADQMLFIREVLLQLKHIMIHCSNRILEAATELRNMEDIVNVRKVRRQFQLISYFFTPFKNSERTNLAKS